MLLTVAIYYSLVEAKLAQGVLAAHGVQSFVADEHMGSFYPMGIGFRLQVAHQALEKAKAILAVE